MTVRTNGVGRPFKLRGEVLPLLDRLDRRRIEQSDRSQHLDRFDASRFVHRGFENDHAFELSRLAINGTPDRRVPGALAP